MLRGEKEEVVSDIASELDKSAGILFVDFTGMDVEQQTNFRVKLREANVGYRVVKNTLMLRALEKSGITDGMAALLKGAPTGVVFGYEDPITAAKTTVEFKKECEALKIKGGILENKALDAKGAEGLSKLPGREEILSELVGLILGPGRNLQALLKGPSGRLLGAIDAKAESEGDEG